MSGNHHAVRDIVDRLERVADRERLTVADVLDAFGPTAFLPVMLIPALLVVSPLSGIPLFSSLCGLTIALVAVQMLAGRSRLWLPGKIRRREIEGARLRHGAGRLQGLADWIDRNAQGRFPLLVGRRAQRFVIAACLLAGATMPLLEIVPFSSSVLGLSVVLLCSGLLTGEGLFVLAGGLAMTGAGAISAAVITGLASL